VVILYISAASASSQVSCIWRSCLSSLFFICLAA